MLGKEEEEEEEVGVVEDMDKALEEVAVDLDMDKVKVSCCGEVTSATTILPAATENIILWFLESQYLPIALYRLET